MSDTNALFIMAAREKFRFPSVNGLLTVEDLWSLPLTARGRANLDDTAKTLYKELKEADGEISFVKPAVKTTTEIQAKFDIVKFVIEVRMAERDAQAEAAKKAELKQKLLAKLAEKQDKSLDEKSEDELKAMIAGL